MVAALAKLIVEGEVVKVDQSAGKITIKHGAHQEARHG